MLMVNKHDLDPKLNLMGLKRGDKIQVEIADVTPMGFTLDPKTVSLTEMRDVAEPREPIMKTPKPKLNSMPLPDLKSMIQHPMPAAPVMPPPPMKM